jgi:hypothetical protein
MANIGEEERELNIPEHPQVPIETPIEEPVPA